MGALSETPSTWLTLLAPPWRSAETLSHPAYKPTKLLTLDFPYEWLGLAHDSQLPKASQTISRTSVRPQPPYLLLRGHQPTASLVSKFGFAWESPRPAQVAAISYCFIAQAGWLWAEHRRELTSACTTWETQGDSYRPCWNTITLPLHS